MHIETPLSAPLTRVLFGTNFAVSSGPESSRVLEARLDQPLLERLAGHHLARDGRDLIEDGRGVPVGANSPMNISVIRSGKPPRN